MKFLGSSPSPLPCGGLKLTPQGRPSPIRDCVIIRHARGGGAWGRFANRPYWIPAPRFRGDKLRGNDGSFFPLQHSLSRERENSKYLQWGNSGGTILNSLAVHEDKSEFHGARGKHSAKSYFFSTTTSSARALADSASP